MRILVLDSALARRTAAIIADDAVIALRTEAGKQGHETILPAMARDVMAEAGAGIDLVAVTVGPGSFTGIRACLALGHGIGLGHGVPVVGVTVGEAIAVAFPHLGGRDMWVVTESRRGYIFLEQGVDIASLAIAALPEPRRPVAIAGAAAVQVASRLAARGVDVLLTDSRFPLPRHIARVAARRHKGELSPRAAQPLYVDPPEARFPAGGLRPPPETLLR
ncbi:MAG: tRNA (adenosine(37)-N6)-threonylcarbamoyltransferase complex dimerization subunit type 1 TsaB [Acetobacteraceae bacterium]|nr:tRNA (adenosine(37)-N6)-threonylcarbamoyltransferase complex dimerization subunit type 1 TsaB [Acetobacteraceae bacterium]